MHMLAGAVRIKVAGVVLPSYVLERRGEDREDSTPNCI